MAQFSSENKNVCVILLYLPILYAKQNIQTGEWILSGPKTVAIKTVYCCNQWFGFAQKLACKTESILHEKSFWAKIRIIDFHHVWFRFWLFPSVQMLDWTGEDPDPHGPKNSLSNWVESFVELMFSLFAMYIKLILSWYWNYCTYESHGWE